MPPEFETLLPEGKQIDQDYLTKSSGRHRDASQRSPVARHGGLKAARRAHYTTAWDVPNAK
jgi:ribosomal protein L4